MPISPVNGRRQPSVGVNVGLAPRKSISFVGASKGTLMKGGYAGANQSRMAMSKNMMILPEAKQVEKMTISSAKTITQVTDINGVDVTPRPLYRPDPYSSTGKPNKLLTSQDGSHTSDFIASYSLYQNTINPSMLGQFTRSVLGSSTVSKSTVSTTESMAEDLEEPSFKRERLSSLTESEEAEKVSQRNKTYETLCRNRLGNDLYVERMMQTINGAPKNKDVQCDKILKEEKGNLCYILLGFGEGFRMLKSCLVVAERGFKQKP
nr:WD repeat-containing protein 78-like [Odocoileus virginianus texanus]